MAVHEKLKPHWRKVHCGVCRNEFDTGNPKPCKDGLVRCRSCYKQWCNVKMLEHLYGLTPQKYQEMLDAQGGSCAICHKFPAKGQKLAVDHDHETGKIRGLLCILCNSTLGYFKDDIQIVKSAAAYLMKHDTRRSWDGYFLDVARAAATRSKDPSVQVGAVIVKDRQILASGYNGFPKGVNEQIPERWARPEKYNWMVHAELNALLQAGMNGRSTEGASIYVIPLSPCLDCAKAIVQCGIKEVICMEPGLLGTGDSKLEQGKAIELLQAAKVLIRKPD